MPLSRRRLLGSGALLAATGLVGGGLAGCSAGGLGSPGGGATQDGGVPTYAYGAQPSQYAELSLPPGSGRVPVVVVVHGGFWLTQYGADLGRPLAADLVTRGWAALNVEYRRVGSGARGGGGWPATGLDVAAAVDALAVDGQRIADGRLDLTRVVGLGHSAGGQLVGWLAGRAGLQAGAPGAAPRVPLTGFVSQAGVLDLVGASKLRLGGGAVDAFLGGSPTQRPDAYAQASPLARLPMGVPSVCVHGTTDLLVPLSQSETFVAAAQQLGDRSELKQFPGDHFALIDPTSQAWTLCVDALSGLLA